MARELLEKIASQSRFTGSDREARARKLCAALLEESGLSVTEHPFTFSEFPGRYGVPMVALILGSVALLASHVYFRHGGAVPAMALLGAGIIVVRAISRWLARRGTSRISWMRSQSVNLVAVRGRPSLWLVAHLDTKSQTIPMLVRVVSVVVAAVVTAGLAGSLLFEWINAFPDGAARPDALWISIWAKLVAIAALPLVLCLTGDRSPGAVDNASGLISVLLATRALVAQTNLGVIVTSGEELGLAGARAFVESNPDRGIAVNCDTIDDHGDFLCMTQRGRSATAPDVARAASRLGLTVRERTIIPGILADSIAFADAGWDSVTISRGNLATLARVHTSGDTRERLDGSGIAKAARLLAATVKELD